MLFPWRPAPELCCEYPINKLRQFPLNVEKTPENTSSCSDLLKQSVGISRNMLFLSKTLPAPTEHVAGTLQTRYEYPTTTPRVVPHSPTEGEEVGVGGREEEKSDERRLSIQLLPRKRTKTSNCLSQYSDNKQFRNTVVICGFRNSNVAQMCC